jgi:hypothetical protein
VGEPDASGVPRYGLTPSPSEEAGGVEGLGSGVTDGLLPEAGAVVAEVVALFDGVADAPVVGAPAVGAWLAQLAAGAGVWPESRPEALARGLELALADALAEALSLALALSAGLALALLVALSFGLSLGLALALAVALPTGLAVPPLRDGLAVLAGALALELGLADGLDDAADRVGLVAGFAEADACERDGDGHGAAGVPVFPGNALPSTPLAPEAWPVPPDPAELAALLDEPANTSELILTNAWPSGRTATSTTATATTAIPMASAGRSITSRQSPVLRCAGRACPGPAPRPGVLPRRSGAP